MRQSRLFLVGAVVGIAIGAATAAVFLAAPHGEGGAARAGGEARGGGAGGSGDFGGARTPAVTYGKVETAIAGRTLEAIGQSRALKSVTLAVETTGLVRKVNIKAGAKVKEGDVLLQLDDEAQRIALAKARAQYPIAEQNAKRYAGLLDDKAASKLEADAAFNAAKAAEADLKDAEYALSQRTIRAPFDGVVGLTTIEAGDYLKAGDIVTSIDDRSKIIIEFASPQELASDVALDQKVTAALAGQQTPPVEGVITAMDSRVDPASRTLRLEATFDNASGAMLAGATYAVTTTSKGARAMAVPGLAVQWDRTGAYVWRLAPDGSAVRADLRILERRNDIVIAEGEISPGDTLIVEGSDRVRPGMKFKTGAVGGVSGASAGAFGAD
ncbi:MAG: efflux RND transporter periplasmic adaptor subunit [Parvularculaceae bacterium]